MLYECIFAEQSHRWVATLKQTNFSFVTVIFIIVIDDDDDDVIVVVFKFVKIVAKVAVINYTAQNNRTKIVSFFYVLTTHNTCSTLVRHSAMMIKII